MLMLGPRHRCTPSEISIHRQKLDEGDDDGEELRFFLKIVIKSGGKIVSSNLTALYLEMNEM